MEKNNCFNRRDFIRTAALGVAGVSAFGFGACGQSFGINDLKIGHTGITWGIPPKFMESAMIDLHSLGFKYFEPFGKAALKYEEEGTLEAMLEKYKLKLTSLYSPVELIDPKKRESSFRDLKNWATLLKKYGGRALALGPGSRPENYDVNEHKKTIIHTLNEMGKQVADLGIHLCVHQHTGTAIETADEVYTIMENVDSNVVKFGPDIGQLQKGGADPVKIVNDFKSIIELVHFKDYDGKDDNGFLGYCPLGKGNVNLEGVLNILTKNQFEGYVMVELDRMYKAPMSAKETATINKQYLSGLGYKFSS